MSEGWWNGAIGVLNIPGGRGLAAAPVGTVLHLLVAQGFEVRLGFGLPWGSAHSDTAALVEAGEGGSPLSLVSFVWIGGCGGVLVLVWFDPFRTVSSWYHEDP